MVASVAPRIIAAIPARFGSQRLPGKLLRLLDGEPLICHTVRAVLAARSVQQVLVATDHADIAAAARDAGADVVMTESYLASGTDRIAAALRSIDVDMGSVDAVVNVQGDEPCIDPDAIDLVTRVLLSTQADMSTLSAPLAADELIDPSKVKVVCTDTGYYSALECANGALPPGTGRALYFSRAPIGVDRDAVGNLLCRANGGTPVRSSSSPNAIHYGCRQHLGIYAFRPAALWRFVALPPAQLEMLERLEQESKHVIP